MASPSTKTSGTGSTSKPSSPQREALLAAAVDVLQTEGPTAFTVRHVTEKANCSTTGVYTWFGGKQGLAEAVFCAAFDRFDITMRSAIGQLNGSPGRVGAIAYRQWARANPTDYVIMFGKAIPDYEPSPAALERALESFELLIGCVREEVKGAMNPVSDATIKQLALHFWSVLHGFVMLELTSMIPVPGEPEALYHATVGRALESFNLSQPD